MAQKKTTKKETKSAPLQVAFDAWLKSIESEGIPKQIVAVNIGLFETKDGYSAYFVGSERFDADDASWACDEDFVPKSKYFPLPSKAFAVKDWPEAQAACKALIESYLARNARSALHRREAVTVGFDDGDLEPVISKRS